MLVPRSVHMVRLPRGSYIVYPLQSLEVATPETKLIGAVIHMHVRLAGGA